MAGSIGMKTMTKKHVESLTKWAAAQPMSKRLKRLSPEKLDKAITKLRVMTGEGGKLRGAMIRDVALDKGKKRPTNLVALRRFANPDTRDRVDWALRNVLSESRRRQQPLSFLRKARSWGKMPEARPMASFLEKGKKTQVGGVLTKSEALPMLKKWSPAFKYD